MPDPRATRHAAQEGRRAGRTPTSRLAGGLSEPGGFTHVAELVSWRGALADDAGARVRALADQLGADGRFAALSITDSAGVSNRYGQYKLVYNRCKDEFRYDARQDAYICPAGQTLTPIREGKLRELKKIDYGNAAACRVCALRPRCSKNFRAVSRLENEDALDRMAERLKARPELLDRRREIVEHPFGSIKQ